LNLLITNIAKVKRIALDAIDWVANLDFPDFSRDATYVSLWDAEEYPLIGGRIRSSGGIDIPEEEFEQLFIETQVQYSTALRYMIEGRVPYVVGPVARVNLNYEKLAPDVLDRAKDTGISFPIKNPFMSIISRVLEVAHCVVKAETIINEYKPPTKPHVGEKLREGDGVGITEAPRGILYHKYSIDAKGTVKKANIVSPTAQNQTMIEADLLELALDLVDMPLEKARWLCEQAIRNYDPCISCSAHFLRLHLSFE